MIEVKVGNMLDHLWDLDGIICPPQFFVHGCNAQGAMGRGIAGEIRQRFPQVWIDYRTHYLLNGLQVGDVVSSTPHDSACVVFNAITQEFYGADPNIIYVDYDAMELCFQKINRTILAFETERPIFDTVLNFPLIGAGLANGDWSRIEQIIDSTVDDRIKKVLWKLPAK